MGGSMLQLGLHCNQFLITFQLIHLMVTGLKPFSKRGKTRVCFGCIEQHEWLKYQRKEECYLTLCYLGIGRWPTYTPRLQYLLKATFTRYI